ncbi:MAG: Sir2 family NAD-dependent protein deacetylase [Deltaproteobacteria bacterium]|nr:Sir2 family NAD-dependent protein deacetylase [Deltaproteobacteria bacterium]
MSDLARTGLALAAKKHVVYLTGAGISVASGISPYRKSKDAVWENFIMDWGTSEKFHADPLRWYREFWLKAHPSLRDDPEKIQPNAGHDALTRLIAKNESHMIITQNIDGLHRRSGAPLERLIEIHGRADQFVCSNLKHCSQARVALDAIDMGKVEAGDVPECEVCGAAIRPLVLLFDEMYDAQPAYRAREARRWLNDADAVVFVGTSFSVGITSMALSAARYANALLVNVNVEPVDVDGSLGFVNLLGPAEEVLPALAAAAGV